MEKNDVFYFSMDDLEIIKYLKSIPKSEINGDFDIINFISKDKFYGKDIVSVFSYQQYVHVLSKIGKIDDSGLILVYTDYEDIEHLIRYIQHPRGPVNSVLKQEVIKKLKQIQYLLN